MNAIGGFPDSAPSSDSDVTADTRQFTLRRTGRKPIRFTGWQIVEVLGASETGSQWYDLTVYRSDSGEVIVELVARRRMIDEQDLSRVEVFGSLAAAGAWLEAYPCASDVPIPTALAAADGPMAIAVLQLVQLRQRIARITEEYHGLLSDVFEVLDIADVAAAPMAQHPEQERIL